MIIRVFISCLTLLCLHNFSFAQGINILLQTGHSKAINDLQVSPDGDYFATAGEDHTVKVWDTKTGTIIRNYEGHGSSVEKLCFGPEGFYLLSASAANKIMIWEIRKNPDNKIKDNFYEYIRAREKNYELHYNNSLDRKMESIRQQRGQQMKTYSGHAASITAMAIGPKLKYFASADESGHVYFWDLTKDKFYAKTVKSFGQVNALCYSPDGKKIFVGTSKGIHVLNSKGDVVSTKFRDEQILQLENSSDKAHKNLICLVKGKGMRALKHGKLDEVAKHDGDFDIFHIGESFAYFRKGNKLTAETGYVDATLDEELRLSAISRKNNLIVEVIGDNNVRIEAHKTYIGDPGQVTTTLHDKPSMNIDYDNVRISPNWQYVANSSEGEGYVQVSDIFHARTELIFTGILGTGSGVALSDHFMSVVLSTGDVKVYDLKSLNEVLTIQSQMEEGVQTIISSDEKYLVLWDELGLIKTYNLANGEYVFHVDVGETVSDVVITGEDAFVAYESGGVYRLGFVTGYDPEKVFSCKPGTKLGISRDGELVSFESQTNEVSVHSTSSLLLQRTLAPADKSRVHSMAFSPDNLHMSVLTEAGRVVIWDMERKYQLSARGAGRRLSQQYPISFSPNGKFVFLVNNDHNLLMWDWKDKLENRMVMGISSTLFLSSNNKYIEAGDGHQLVKFRSGERVFDFTQFDLHFNRPDKVLKHLGFAPDDLIMLYNKAYNKRLKKLGYKNSRVGNNFHIPKVSIQNTQDLGLHSVDKKVKLMLNASDTKYPLEAIRIYVNGVPINAEKGINLKGKKLLSYEGEIEIELSKGKNKVEVSSRNNLGAESMRAYLDITYTGPAPKPKLHVLAIGISDYKQKAMNLSYASKDARDFVRMFEGETKIFDGTNTKVLDNENATKSGIISALEAMNNVSVDDYVYIFMAGHGVLDMNLDYFIAAHDMDFSNPKANGVAYTKLESLLEQIPSRHKVLFIDACHSGEIDKDAVKLVKFMKEEKGKVKFRATGPKVETLDNSFEMMKLLFDDLERGSGTTVISAAGGAEFALEGSDWNNGVFTYCLIDGIKNKQADNNGDGKVMLLELFSYLQHKVPEVTGGQQQPTTRSMNKEQDILIK